MGEGTRRGEFSLIGELLAPLAGDDPRALGLTDDAAVLPQRDGRETVITTDTMVESVHFLASEPPAIVAKRLLRVNLSDVASMGATPIGYFLNLTLSRRIGDAWLEDFAAGLREDQERFGVNVLGGDTTSTPGPLTLSLTALGELPAGTAVRRSGAGAGDVVMVSGTIGDATLGLKAIADGSDAAALIARYQLPEPRTVLGPALRGIASAMADVSDGLIADLGHIAEASRLGASVDAVNVPLSPEARAALDAGDVALSDLLTGGDDYELVFTVPRGREDDARDAARAAGVAVSEIGRMSDRAGPVVALDAQGEPMLFGKTGFRHF